MRIVFGFEIVFAVAIFKNKNKKTFNYFLKNIHA